MKRVMQTKNLTPPKNNIMLQNKKAVGNVSELNKFLKKQKPTPKKSISRSPMRATNKKSGSKFSRQPESAVPKTTIMLEKNPRGPEPIMIDNQEVMMHFDESHSIEGRSVGRHSGLRQYQDQFIRRSVHEYGDSSSLNVEIPNTQQLTERKYRDDQPDTNKARVSPVVFIEQ